MNKIAQASALPFRIYKNKLQVLIITSRNGKKWIIPKGIIEPGDSDRYTALKETREEAGVNGKVLKKVIGSYSYEKWDSICEVTIYPLKVTEVYEQWDESHFRKRKWVNARRAVKKVEPKVLANLIKEFAKNNEINLTEM
jgi:phosphohistidine phosphatase